MDHEPGVCHPSALERTLGGGGRCRPRGALPPPGRRSAPPPRPHWPAPPPRQLHWPALPPPPPRAAPLGKPAAALAIKQGPFGFPPSCLPRGRQTTRCRHCHCLLRSRPLSRRRRHERGTLSTIPSRPLPLPLRVPSREVAAIAAAMLVGSLPSAASLDLLLCNLPDTSAVLLAQAAGAARDGGSSGSGKPQGSRCCPRPRKRWRGVGSGALQPPPTHIWHTAPRASWLWRSAEEPTIGS